MQLELLAPARDKNVGTAAIDCGADAVYIAGPQFGARVAAGNSIEDIAELCRYAHLFGAKIYATANTLIREDEISNANRLLWQYYEAGVDALILQDMSLLEMDLPPMPLHASTQTVIRTPQRALELEKAGFTRLILERQLSLEQIKAIRQVVSCELEFFVHGALCMSYSGECYLSEVLAGRSANRGCCAQPCRSRYDVLDQNGRVIASDRHILSLKDFRLDNRIAELAEAGICSFKIEGRLKNASYVKNVVRHYRNVIDSFIAGNPEYGKSSYGEIVGGFSPDPDITFNRGYTDCFIEGARHKWNSVDAAKSLGQHIGVVEEIVSRDNVAVISGGNRLSNGDGLSFSDGENVIGMRAEVVRGNRVSLKDVSGIRAGMRCFRNMNLAFEKELERNMPRRLMDVELEYSTNQGHTVFSATFCNGRKLTLQMDEEAPEALNRERAVEMLRAQLEKTSGPFRFRLAGVRCDRIYSYTASYLNSVRRRLAEMGQAMMEERNSLDCSRKVESKAHNLSTLVPGKVLMKSKYCVRYELGLCSRTGNMPSPLYIVNNGRKLKLLFDCENCEMSVTL